MMEICVLIRLSVGLLFGRVNVNLPILNLLYLTFLSNSTTLNHILWYFKFFLQFNAFAISRAVVVFPTPRIPVKRYALGNLLN